MDDGNNTNLIFFFLLKVSFTNNGNNLTVKMPHDCHFAHQIPSLSICIVKYELPISFLYITFDFKVSS